MSDKRDTDKGTFPAASSGRSSADDEMDVAGIVVGDAEIGEEDDEDADKDDDGESVAVPSLADSIQWDSSDGLPDTATLVTKTGGVFTGNPTFTGRGGYLYHNNAANTSGRVFVQASGGSTPSGMANGDMLLEY